ncbi:MULTISPECIES: substrate-binding domain-containing protein [unclassified Methylibium]|uniref:molybdate ABC transporter substrate-binding protein n=1 Tax=unclassified Methylibium TaxID=2633235 RepID=UPI0003F44878|nr:MULTISPECIES: substrate-binding domain-containing protein [unclassified Methylibium]MBI5270785.1 substrate-binding domain-containing protein [Burkholderiales bacterium]AIA99078.1 molybdate transporter periplasmic protein [Methylibium sp. T29]AIA99175.1 molybdate transporter periplasmic protein [Methylibium sp. T29-B]EWS56336.1 molybdate transporter periplasmic protein [Methylibium sp. T29]EWS60847.1 molybdate transporter periplasmic protein [Methylibium sp. T29-B]
MQRFPRHNANWIIMHVRLWMAAIWDSAPSRHIAVAMALALGSHAFAAELKVIAPNAVKETVTEIAKRFERESEHRVVFTWAGSETISKRTAEGEVFDVVINAAQNIDRGATDGKLVPGSRADFAKSGIGVAVRSGLPRPDVSTVDGLRQALIKANSIAISSGTSGRYLESLFRRLGVAEQIKSKIVQPPSGAQIGEFIARGDAELGFQQVAELLHAKGVEFLGALPPGVQSYTVWSAGLHGSSTQVEVARSFIAALKSAESAAAIKTTGMEPM